MEAAAAAAEKKKKTSAAEPDKMEAAAAAAEKNKTGVADAEKNETAAATSDICCLIAEAGEADTVARAAAKAAAELVELRKIVASRSWLNNAAVEERLLAAGYVEQAYDARPYRYYGYPEAHKNKIGHHV